MIKAKRKILDWLSRFLTAYANEKYKEEIEKLENKLTKQKSVIERQDAYINGLEKALKYKQVIIKSEVK